MKIEKQDRTKEPTCDRYDNCAHHMNTFEMLPCDELRYWNCKYYEQARMKGHQELEKGVIDESVWRNWD